MCSGALSLLGGFRRLLGEPTLRGVLWRMLALLILLMILLTGGVFWLTDHLASLWIPEGDAWYWRLLGGLAWLFALLLAAVTGVIGFTVTASAAIAPWLDLLAARSERLAGGSGEEAALPWWRLVAASLGNSVRPLLGMLALGAAAVLLLLVPVIGPPLATFVWGYAGLRLLLFELIDTPASRRGWDFNRRREELGRERLFYLGFGGVAMALMFLPLVNLLVIPAAVVALSRRYVAG